MVLNEEYLEIDSPTILVSNHPSTLTDPLNAAKHVDAVVHFLANAGLFKNKIVGKLLRKFYCIPIERPVDVNGRKINNKASFQRSYDFLAKGGTLYIAAEGGSKMVRRVRKFKTGAARIALQAEEDNDFKLGIKLMPVGINYASPTRFRSDLIIHAGKPIYAKDYMDLYQKDSIKAARKMTTDLHDRMKQLVIHTEEENEDLDKLLQKLQSIKRNDKKWSFLKEYEWAQEKLKALRSLKISDVPAYEKIRAKANEYCAALDSNGIHDVDLLSSPNLFTNFIFRILGFFPAVFGYLNNLLLHLVPKSVIEKEGFYKGYSSTVYILFGLIAMPILYLTLFFLVKWLSTSYMIALLYLLLAFTLGFFASHYFRSLNKFKRQKKVSTIKKEKPGEFEHLMNLRKDLNALIANTSKASMV